MARRKPLYFTISTMFQILTKESPRYGNSDSARSYVNKFKKHTEINKAYDKIVRKFNKSNGDTLKIKRCNFHYDQYGNPVEDPKEKNPWGFQQFKVINTGKLLETENFPVITLIEFAEKFLEELAKEVDLSDVFYYPNWNDPNLEYEIGWPNEDLAKEIRTNAFCSLASISNPYAVKNQPAYQPLIKFLKQKIGLSNNPSELKKVLKLENLWKKLNYIQSNLTLMKMEHWLYLKLKRYVIQLHQF